MEKQTIRIIKGDSAALQETITGLTSLEGYSAALYIAMKDGEELDVLAGEVDGLVVTYEITAEESKDYPTGVHEFETKLWNEEGNVFTPSKGKFILDPVIENDPNTE